jgi:hypothetical protein
MSVDRIELTVFGKEGGPLTKRIWLCEEDGSVKSDGSQCIMARGRARRVVLERMQDFGVLIDSFQSNEALATGALRDDLPPQVEVTTKRKLNGHRQPELITRTQEYIVYRSGTPSLVLLDFDRKGMPSAVANRLQEIGGVWNALAKIVPALAAAGRVQRASTSAGLFNAQTGEKIHGSGGCHF